MLVNNAGTLHRIDIEILSSILPYITFCVPVIIKKGSAAGVNKHWVMLNVVLCKSFPSCGLPWPGLWQVGAVLHSWMKSGGTTHRWPCNLWPPLLRRALLPSAWHVSLVTSCCLEVIYLASDPLLEMPICFHTPVEPDNILTIPLSSGKF